MKFFYTVVNRGLIVKYWELGLPFYILHGAEKSYTKWDIITLFTGGFKAAATSKMERFVIIVNGWKSLTIITKRSILDVAAILDPPLRSDKRRREDRRKWKIRIAEDIFMGKGNTIRSVRMHTGESIIERPVQLLYSRELHDKPLNFNAEQFWTRRSSAAVVKRK